MTAVIPASLADLDVPEPEAGPDGSDAPAYDPANPLALLEKAAATEVDTGPWLRCGPCGR